MKKYFVLLFSFILIILSFSVCYAGSYNDLIDTKYEGIVDALSFLKIVDGVADKIYDANKVVTRAELSKMLVIAHGYDKSIKLLDAPEAFKDVKSGSWYYDYVNIAAAYGLVKGYPDDNFYPDKEVTYSEAVTMILRSLGHNYIREDSEYGWDFNYIQRMRELKLNEGMETFRNSDGARRGEVAILIWNMLNSTTWEIIEEEGTGTLTYSDSGKVLLDKAFENEYELVSGKKIKYLSYQNELMYANVENYGESELDQILPFYAIGSKMTGVYGKKDKKLVVVSYDIDCAIVDGYADELKEDGYKLKGVKDKYYFGGKDEDYIFYAVIREGSDVIIDRAMILDLDSKILIEEIKTEKDILTINDEIEIDIKKAVLLDGKKVLEWSKLTKNDAILPIVNGEIYILANAYRTEDEIDDSKKNKNKNDSLYFISDIAYTADDKVYVGLISSEKNTHMVCTAKVDSFEVGNLVLATIEKNQITELKKATEKDYADLKVGKELVINYINKEYLSGMIGKYRITKDTEIYLLDKRYQNNSDKIIEKCTLEKVNEDELRYVADDILDIIYNGNVAEIIYIERESNKFSEFYGRVRDVIVDKKIIKLDISPVDAPIKVYETAGRVDCEVGDLISYTLNDKDVLRINEVYHSGVIGYKGDLVVEGVNGKDVLLTNGESFNQTSNVISVNGKEYKLSNYKIIVAKVRKEDDSWRFSSTSFDEMKKVKFSVGDRIAIDELEGVVVIYSGYTG